MTPETLAQQIHSNTQKEPEKFGIDIITILAILKAVTEIIKMIQECQKNSTEVKGWITKRRNRTALRLAMRENLPWGQKHLGDALADEVYKVGDGLDEEQIAQLISSGV